MARHPMLYGRQSLRPLHEDRVGHALQRVRFVNNKNNNGQTALHLVAAGGQMESVQLLQERSANIGAIDNNERTALHLAVTG